MSLKIFLLGAPRVEQLENPVEFDTRKATALLAYLAITGEGHRRDSLATFLWPDNDQVSARAALRRTLSSLRKGIGEGLLVVAHDKIGLIQTARIWVDVLDFRQKLQSVRSHQHAPDTTCQKCVETLVQAVDLYRDDFLSGFSLRDSASFDDWQFFLTDELRRDLAWALESLSTSLVVHGNYAPAITYARRWLSLDPLREEAHRQLMVLYNRAGQRNAALRQYRECVRILEQELGVPPLEETTCLYQEILESRTALPQEPISQATITPVKSAQKISASLSSYPLVGRKSEWQALVLSYHAAQQDGWLAGLEGEVGIGKTRLAEELAFYARSQGSQVFQARCYEGEANLTFGPFILGIDQLLKQQDILQRLKQIPSHWLEEAARLCPEIYSLAPGLPAASQMDSPGAQSRFFEGIRQVLTGLLAGPLPGVFFMDDLHWADTATLDLLAYLARRLEGAGLLLLITWRAEISDNDAQISQLIEDARRRHRCTHLLLHRLEAADIDELAHSVNILSSLPGEQFARRLYKESEGLPLLAVTYLEAALQNNDWDQDKFSGLMGDVRHILHARIDRMEESARQLLSTAAVIGRSFDLQVLQTASGRSEVETVNGLESLLRHDLITERGQAAPGSEVTYDFTHEKLRELVYQEISLARRRLLHRRIAEAILNSPNGRRDVESVAALVAQHYQQAGENLVAAEYFKRAGDHAGRLLANHEAISHYRTALACGYVQTAQLHALIGDLQVLQGEYPPALTSYETAAALSSAEDLPLIEHKLGLVHHFQGNWELAVCHFQAALEELKSAAGIAMRSRIFADWSRTAHLQAQDDQAQELAQKALSAAEESSDARALAQANNILGVLARNRGDFSSAMAYLERSLDAAETLANPEARITTLNNLALVYRDNGELDQAIRMTGQALVLCEQQGNRHHAAALYNNLADLYHAQGDAERSMEYLHKAVALFSEIGLQAGDLQPEIWKLTEW